MIVVVADTSPLHYLVLIESVEILPAMYGGVLIPRTVALELNQPRTPEAVRRWIQDPPNWLEIADSYPSTPFEAHLDPGERDAISLALARRADLVLMDDREGVEEASKLGLTITGTLGVWTGRPRNS